MNTRGDDDNFIGAYDEEDARAPFMPAAFKFSIAPSNPGGHLRSP